MSSENYGKLYMIPTTLGESDPLAVLPLSVKSTIESLTEFIVENEKSARRFIKSIAPEVKQPELKLHALNKHTDVADIPSFLNSCLEGKNIGLISEAGVPGIADPGADVAKLAHEKGIKVVPLVGPSSIVMAMMASGMNGQNFAFNGYLPIDDKERKNAIKRLEKLSGDVDQSQSFIETPYRNNKMLDVLCSVLAPSTKLCIACDITLPTEFIKTAPIQFWKKSKPDLHKRPAIFIIQK